MVWRSISMGLAVWLRAVFRLAAGLACSLSLIVAGYALIVRLSPHIAVTLVAFAVLASLTLAGWWRYCGVVAAEGRARPRALLAGFEHPVRGFIAGFMPLFVVCAPIWLVETWLDPVLPPGARAGIVFIAALLAMPATLIVPFAAMAYPLRWELPYRLGWSDSLAAALVIFAIGGLGPATWLFLEAYALDIVIAGLPISIAPFGPGIVRSAGVIVGLFSVPAASCIWAATYGPPRLRRHQRRR